MAIRDRIFAAIRAFGDDASPTRTLAPAPPIGDTRRPSTTQKKSGTNFDPPNQDRYPRILGSDATPGALSRALRDATRGRMSLFCDVASEMRETTPQIAALMAKRNGAVSGAKILVDPAQVDGKRDKKRAARNADYLRLRVGQVDGFADRIDHLCDGNFFGRSGLQIDWKRDRDGIGIDVLHDIAPKRFSYAANWRIHLWDERGNQVEPALGNYPGVDIRTEWPDRFIIHEPKVLGSEIATRQGLARVLIWCALFWKSNARFALQFIETWGNPWRVATVNQANDGWDFETIRDELVNMSGLSAGVFPAGCVPTFLQPRETRAHIDWHNIWNAEIAKIISGGTLGAELSGSGGSRAAAEVHERGEQKLVMGDSRRIDATLKRDLVQPLMRLNFGDDDADHFCPCLRLDTAPIEDKDTFATRIWGFVDRGGEVDADAVREQLLTGLKAPDAGAPTLKPLAAGKPAPEAGPLSQSDKNDAADTQDAKDAADEGSAKPAKNGSDGAAEDVSAKPAKKN